jgi:hypothetical protein
MVVRRTTHETGVVIVNGFGIRSIRPGRNVARA